LKKFNFDKQVAVVYRIKFSAPERHCAIPRTYAIDWQRIPSDQIPLRENLEEKHGYIGAANIELKVILLAVIKDRIKTVVRHCYCCFFNGTTIALFINAGTTQCNFNRR
jgi:hypothetical protein